MAKFCRQVNKRVGGSGKVGCPDDRGKCPYDTNAPEGRGNCSVLSGWRPSNERANDKDRRRYQA